MTRTPLGVGSKRECALATVGLAGLVVALFSDAVFRGRVFYERDLHLDWYTQMEAFVRAVAAGSWPVWDNTIAFGQPLLADPSAQILYPLTWLNLALQPWWYYTVFVVFHACFGGLGVYLLSRRLQVSFPGASMAAGLWVCSGPLLSMLNTWQHFAAAAWIGWVLVAAHDLAESPGLSQSVTWATALAGQVLAGSADVSAMSWLLATAYLAGRLKWRTPSSPANRRLLGCAATAVGLAIALSAAVWLPALDVARRSSRWSYPQDVREAWSLQPAMLAGLVLPARVQSLADVLPQPLAPAPESREPLLPSLYLGAAAVPLVVKALLSRRRGGVFLATAGAVALLVALGTHGPLYPFAVRVAPIFGIFRYPCKTMIVVAFTWAVLAGIGLDAYAKSPSSRRALPLGWLAGLAALATAVLPRLFDSEARDRGTLALACALCVALALLAARTVAGLLPRWTAVVAVLAIGDVFVAHRGMNRTAPAGLLAFRPPAVSAVATEDGSRLYVYDYMAQGKSLRYLRRDDPYMIRVPPGRGAIETIRVLSQRLYLFPPVGGRWGLEGSFDLDLRGLYPIPLARLVDLLGRVEGTPSHLRLLRIGAVRTVMALHTEGLEDLIPLQTVPSYFPEPIHVLRVPDPLPRTYAVGAARETAEPGALAALLDPRFDMKREIVLPPGRPVRSVSGFSGISRITSFKPDRVRIESEMEAPGYVVLVDSFDPGWRATVDGTAVPVLRANVAFRAVEVPRGRHVIDFVYRPPAVLWGLGVTAAAAGVAIAFSNRARDHRS